MKRELFSKFEPLCQVTTTSETNLLGDDFGKKLKTLKVNKDMTNKTQNKLLSFSGKRGATKHLSQPTTTSPRTQDQQIINKRTETSHNKAKSTNNPGQNQQTLTRLIRVTKIHYDTTRRTTFLPNNRGSNRRWPNTKLS